MFISFSYISERTLSTDSSELTNGFNVLAILIERVMTSCVSASLSIDTPWPVTSPATVLVWVLVQPLSVSNNMHKTAAILFILKLFIIFVVFLHIFQCFFHISVSFFIRHYVQSVSIRAVFRIYKPFRYVAKSGIICG